MAELTKTEASNIAKVMIASMGINFDLNAFDECDDMINENDKDLIILEIQKQCKSTIDSMSQKIKRPIDTRSTESIIESMYYEDED